MQIPAARRPDPLAIREVAPWRALLGHVRPHSRVLVGGAVLGLIGSAAGLAQPLVAKAVIDALSQRRSLVEPLLILTGLVVASAGVSAAGKYVLERTAETVVLAARVRLISRMLRLRVGTLDRLKPGDLLSRVTSDTTLLRNVCTHSLVGGVNAVFTLLGAIVLMATLDVMLLGLTLAVVVVVGGTVALVMSRISSATERSQAAVGEMGSVLERALGAFRTVKASGAEQRELAEITEAARTAYRHGVEVARWTALAGIPAGLAVQLSFLVVLGVGGARVATGALTVSALIAFLLYLFYLVDPIGALVEAATQLHVGLAAVRRIREVEKLPGEPPAGSNAAAPPDGCSAPAPASVAFRDVCFRYQDNSPLAHNHVTFAAVPGGMTAIVGPSGAGKTTVFALLQRFYDPERGVITLDGRDIAHWPLAELRSTIGYVEQEAPILAGTLRDNLRYAAPLATDDEMRAAMARTRLMELLERLPDGLDTAIGHRGTTLSGGERQRIAIARALLRTPRLLLLDEATSQLDAMNESALRQVLADITQTTTVIVIAHRLSTVTSAQKIVVMASGRTRANGTHAELVASDDLYRNLAATQLLAR
ncbi:MAG: ABC transporter ATP-binding protein [Pseudonocardiales bacterium]